MKLKVIALAGLLAINSTLALAQGAGSTAGGSSKAGGQQRRCRTRLRGAECTCTAGTTTTITTIIVPESRQIALGIAQVHAHTVGMDMPKLTVHFACPHCGALFTATQEHQPGAGTFECTHCGWLVHEWSGPYNFIDWKRA
jgi:predicted RNA-binding Zn-ribbon protein involved in translation (DUF1610 family)